MKAKGPQVSLDKVRELCGTRDAWILSKSKAEQPLVKRFSTRKAAYTFAKKVLEGLTPGNFYRPKTLEGTAYQPTTKADEYGVVVDGEGWYIKIAIEGEEREVLSVISFHPPKYSFRTKDGTVIPADPTEAK